MEANQGIHTNALHFRQGEDILMKHWNEFLTKFPTNESCLQEFYRVANIDLTTCRKCGCQNVVLEAGMRNLRCLICRRRSSLTAGTFFDHSKRPQLWVGAVWLLESGALLTASQFKRLTKSAYSSASLIFKKATLIAANQLDEGNPEVASAHFIKLFGKRSKLTPSGEHPEKEEPEGQNETNQQSETKHRDDADGSCGTQLTAEHGSTSSAVSLDSDEQLVLEHLSRECQSIDQLVEKTGIESGKLVALLTMMEFVGAIQSHPGGLYARPKTSNVKLEDLDPKLERLVDALISRIKFHYVAISRKYLQNMVAACWCRYGRERGTTPTLVEACYRSRPITYKVILNYVTPPAVRLWHHEFA